MSQAAWDYHDGRVLGLQRAASLQDGNIDITLLLLNAGDNPIEFMLPSLPCAMAMQLDSSAPDARPGVTAQHHVKVAAHGLVLLAGTEVQSQPES